ncbi:glycosyltransferase family 39 protein [Hymenobacter fastidiosus]|uniref:Glycosyltransferase family 39 protein n=1 Tax=Hymenobacter fastidiosus TaxID=486264 RepID=A0ABP7SEB9_9BACT
MEARNFVAAREMVAGGSWLIPTMNGEVRLAKPPLPTWAVAALQCLTGPTEELWLLRLPAALAATVLVFFFWGLARELTRAQLAEAAAPGRTAWLGSLVLASSLLVMVTGREGQWDIFATSLMIGALWLLVRGWQRVEAGGRAYFLFSGAGLLAGFSMLSKGPVTVYAVLMPFVGAYLVGYPEHRQQVARQGWGTVVAATVALLVGLSWPIYIGLQVAPIARKVARTEIASWGERHVQPFWYYWSFFAFTGLWALVALVSLAWPYARPRLRGFIPYALALGWVVAGLLLLSVVPEKKERYMFPLMPPLALLVAGMLRYWETQRISFAKGTGSTDKRVLWVWGSLLLIVFLVLPGAMALSHLPEVGFGSARLVVGIGVFGALAGWVGWQGIRHLCPRVLIAATLIGVCSGICLLIPAYPGWQSRKATPGLRHMRDMRQHPALFRLASWRSLDTVHVKQVWAAGRPIPIWQPALDSLAALRAPVAVFTASPAGSRLPMGWENHVRVILLDSFYLGRDRESGYWFISLLKPVR